MQDRTESRTAAEPEQTLKALRESEARYRNLLEAAPDGIFVTRKDCIVYINPMGLQLLGASRAEQFLGRSPFDIIHPESHKQVRQRIRSLLEGTKYTAPIQERFLRLNGSPLDVEVSATPITDQGEPAMLVFFRNVTERKRAEEALRAREAQLRLITDNLPVLIAYIDTDLRYRFNNRGYEEWFGLAAAELNGKHLREVLGAAAYSAIEPQMRKVLNGELVHFEEEVSYAPPAGKRMIDLTYVPDRAEDGRVRGFFALIFDVTKRRATERALAENEQRLKLAIDVAGMGTWDLDLRTGKMLFSENYFHLLGYTPSPDGVGSAEMWQKLIYTPDRQRVLGAWEKSLRDKSEFSSEHRILRADTGQMAWLRIFGRFIYNGDGEACRSIGVVFDDTQRRHAEQELVERRAEMEQMLQLHVASQTAAAIAHELNQPLHAIASYNEAALRMLQAGNPKPGKLIHAIESSVQQTQRVGLALRHLLEFLHKGETVTEAVDLNQSVHDALDTLAADGYDGFQRILELAPDLPKVQANEVQVQRVLINLLRNGIEAMRSAGIPAGPITVTVRTTVGATMAHVTVRDSGPGLTAEAAKRIFEPFFTTKPEGIGMGLAISRALIEAHGGSLWADRDKGPGASFHFTLPFAP